MQPRGNCQHVPPIQIVITNIKREQESIYYNALTEISHGRKQTHWMWYIFPSVCTVRGHTQPHVLLPNCLSMNDYLDDHILGPRLVEITHAATLSLNSGIPSRTLFNGMVDDEKFHHTVTTGLLVSEYYNRPERIIFSHAIDVLGRGLHGPTANQFHYEIMQLFPGFQGKKSIKKFKKSKKRLNRSARRMV
jgi:uncharacterized protein (DUF1810 family)